MRVGVDATCLANGRGYGRFARELLTALVAEAPAEFVLFADARAVDAARETRGTVVEVPQTVSPTIAASSDGRRGVKDMFRFTRAVWDARVDVFFSPSVYSYFPLPPRLPLLVGIHDAIADRFPELTLPSVRARLFWKAKTQLALFQSALVLTVSDYAADDISEWYHIPRRRIRIAVEAPSSSYSPSDDVDAIRLLAASYGVPQGGAWFVYVGGFNPHKRLDTLVRAFSVCVERCRTANMAPPHLLLVGSLTTDVFHGDAAAIRASIETAGINALTHWTGFVDDDRLRLLLAGATALVLPSEREGFGLPAVEAAACGTPVIATLESPLPVLLAGGGFFVRPRDFAGVSDAMWALLNDPTLRRIMGATALACARRLSWNHAAAATWSALQEIAA